VINVIYKYSFWAYWFIFCGIIMGRYFITAGSTYWLCYWAFRKSLTNSALKLDWITHKAIFRDIKLSVISGVLFALSATLIMLYYDRGMTRIYLDWQAYGSWYLAVSFMTVLILQDTYFYFVHRLFHLPVLFKWLHQGHHQSKIPTPWTSFAFDPLEAIVQASFLLMIVFVLPLHVAVLVALLLTMTIWSIGNHLGFKIVPISLVSRWFGQWCIGSAHHLIHHHKFNRHYGLYFTFWDKLLGTQDANYERQYGHR
jgi:Delta7-sterol 5-desaturase